MSDELKQTEAVAEEVQAEAIAEEAPAAEAEAKEETTMADLEEHFDDANPWNLVKSYMDEGKTLTVKIEGIVKGGAIAMVEGIRGFIPASRLSLSYVSDLESFLLQEIEVKVIDVKQKENRLVLSAKEILAEKAKAAKAAKIAAVEKGSIMTGVVDSIKAYGAFVNLPDGLSGLVHISQISRKRIKTPEDVLKVGQEIKVKVLDVKDGKISLSMKALEEAPEAIAEKVEKAEKVVIPKAESIGTSMADLLKNIKL